MKRRDFLISMAAGIPAGYLLGAGITSGLAQTATELRIQTARFKFRNRLTKNLISLSADSPPPVLYGTQGEEMRLNVTNTLDEYTAMHWHGVRLPNKMDGVPYLTQLPIGENGSYSYRFAPPDAGTYWYHPHCMTMTQMARGLTGVIVIKERKDPGFNGDQIINLRDFKLDESDALTTPYSLRGAARSGTHGNVMTANWLDAPVYTHPSGGLVRLRVVNTDTTRIYRLRLTGGAGRVIAWDGHPVEQEIPFPTQQTPLVLGPGQRADIALLMPGSEGQKVTLMARAPGGEKVMAELVAEGVNLKRNLSEIAPLPRNPVRQPDIRKAKIAEFVFGWSPDGSAPNNGFCGSLGKNFWSINRKPWPGDNASGTGPLANLKLGESYILRLRNESPNLHPIHLHGLTFRPIRSNKRKLPANWTDTALLLKNEVIDVALVADNPGDWAFHCHVIEHQKTGLAGYVRVG